MESLLLLAIFRLFIPSSVPLSWYLKKRDVRLFGSTNAGAANMIEIFGPTLGILTLAIDASKGALAFWIGHRIGGLDFAYICGFAAVAGHCLPEALSFRGGKGIATSLGILSICGSTVYLKITILVFGLAFAASGTIVSIASVISAIFLPLIAIVTGSPIMAIIFSLQTLVIMYRHKDNLIRFFQGKEKPLLKRVVSEP